MLQVLLSVATEISNAVAAGKQPSPSDLNNFSEFISLIDLHVATLETIYNQIDEMSKSIHQSNMAI